MVGCFRKFCEVVGLIQVPEDTHCRHWTNAENNFNKAVGFRTIRTHLTKKEVHLDPLQQGKLVEHFYIIPTKHSG